MQYGCRIYYPKARLYSTVASNPPLIRIDNGTFYRRHPSSTTGGKSHNPAIFSGLSFELSSPYYGQQQHWAVIGPSNAGKTTFFQILLGQHICCPPTARLYPLLSCEETDARYRNPARAIKYVGFDGDRAAANRSAMRGAYLSARYESRREDTDFSVLDYLQDNTELNPLEERRDKEIRDQDLYEVIKNLNLDALISMPISTLSNGQTRRARIAKALLEKPMVLLLDEPFMGLDPPTVSNLVELLYRMAEANAPRLVLALRPQDSLPQWITHAIRLSGSLGLASQGRRENAFSTSSNRRTADDGSRAPGISGYPLQPGLPMLDQGALGQTITESGQSHESLSMTWQSPCSSHSEDQIKDKQILISMRGVRIKYGEKAVLGNWQQTGGKHGLWWDVHYGQRWGIFGPNGSGKTTLLSLISSDHPQAYSQPIKIFGQSRLPQPGRPGVPIFDIQARIGQSSPEIHAFFPKTLTIRQTLESAWADTFLGTPRLIPDIEETVNACLRWFEVDLKPGMDPRTNNLKEQQRLPHAAIKPNSIDWADNIKFGETSVSAQRVALFLRAIIKKPHLVILDEAFSGMDNCVRDKCMLFLTWGEFRSFGIAKVDGADKRYIIPTHRLLLKDHKAITGFGEDQALICVSHVKEEVPGLVRQWMRLPDPGTGEPPKMGTLSGPLEADDGLWNRIWGL